MIQSEFEMVDKDFTEPADEGSFRIWTRRIGKKALGDVGKLIVESRCFGNPAPLDVDFCSINWLPMGVSAFP
jgi:hypothetical protein